MRRSPVGLGVRLRQRIQKIARLLRRLLRNSAAGATHGDEPSDASLLRRGGPDDAKEDPGGLEPHEGLILGVAEGPDGDLVATRQVLTVEDRNTELGAALVHRLTVSETDAQVVCAAWAPGEVTDIGTARAVLRVAASPMVEVDFTTDPTTGAVATYLWPASDLPDQLLAVLTRARLDQDSVRPRLHGAALVNDNGQALLVLGPSRAGKSTLAAHLAAAGLRLINDEQVTLYSSAGLVAGFTRPVAIKRPGLDHLPAGVDAVMAMDQRVLLVPAAALGSAHRLTGRPAMVVLPERADDEAEVSWEQVNAQKALEELCANNLDLVTRPAEGLKAFAWLVASAPMVRLRYRDAADAVSPLLGLLAEPPTIPAVSWSVDEEMTHGEETAPAAASVGTGHGGEPGLGARRRTGIITVHLGEEAVVFDPSSRHVARLNAAATMVWDSLPWPLQADRFVATAPEELEAFLDELFELGFLEADDRLDDEEPGTGREAPAVTAPRVGVRLSGPP